MTRYEELVSLYLDGEPSEAELNELAEVLRDDLALAKDFRARLMLWEAWSQETAPERSADAFLAAFHTRLRAESDAAKFELSMTKQLRKRKGPVLWQPLIAIAAVLVILLSLSMIFNPADIDTGLIASAEASMVRIHGECVCSRCVLGAKGPCDKAIRYVDEAGETNVVRLARCPRLQEFRGCFCGGPTAVMVEGEIVEENGEKMLIASNMELEDEKKM